MELNPTARADGYHGKLRRLLQAGSRATQAGQGISGRSVHAPHSGRHAPAPRLSGLYGHDAAEPGPTAGLCYDPLTPTIFHEPWWLNAASGGCYQEVSVSNGGGMVGRLPFVVVPTRAGCSLCRMPELTHFLGPAVDWGRGTPANRALRHDGIVRDLLARLPPTSGFHQTVHRELRDTLVCQDAGYRTDVQFTFEIGPASSDTIWAAMRDKTRNVIRRASEQYSVVELDDPAEFVAFYDANLQSRGLSNYYSHIDPICEAALRRGRGRLIAAADQAGHRAAAIFYGWDARVAYYLMSTRRADSGNGAVSLLIWHALQDCSARGLTFDFDGVGTPGSRLFFAGFGGQSAPRYTISRYSPYHKMIDGLRSVARSRQNTQPGELQG